MLKHKLKKTTEKMTFGRKNAEKKKSSSKENLYAKVRKSQTRRELFSREKLSSTLNDGGYFTGGESFYELPDLSKSIPEEKEADPVGEQNQQNILFSPVAFYMAVPVVWCRRATPQEDFLWTSQGIENLVVQQTNLVNDLTRRLETKTKQYNSVKRGAEVDKSADFWSMNHKKSTSSAGTNPLKPELNLHVQKTGFDKEGDLTGSTVSSMDRIRRLLEIEEMRSFSEKLNI